MFYHEPSKKYRSPGYHTSVHHIVLMWGVQGLLCNGGALNQHIIQGHGGPVRFEFDMNQKHGPEDMLKVPLSY